MTPNHRIIDRTLLEQINGVENLLLEMILITKQYVVDIFNGAKEYYSQSMILPTFVKSNSQTTADEVTFHLDAEGLRDEFELAEYLKV